MLQISPRRVAHVIVRARELETKVASLGLTAGGHDADSILESRRGDATASELSAFIARLNDDEKASLVALAWIGRETYEAEELEEAMRTARQEATTPTEDYLLGMPLLADYLEEGLDKLGISSTEAEEDFL